MEKKPYRCPCGGAGCVPQRRMIRVPSTFKACVTHIFCMGGCNREGVGMSSDQAVDRWNITVEEDRAHAARMGRDLSKYDAVMAPETGCQNTSLPESVAHALADVS